MSSTLEANSVGVRFTIVMPSTMRDYKTAATGRKWKIMRAIESVINQSFTNWQLWIVADGCEETFDIVNIYSSDERIECSVVKKSMLWSGGPRNYGIHHAQGEYIIYLDIDDYFGSDHLKVINEELHQHSNPDWAWFNDKTPVKFSGGRLTNPHIVWNERACDIRRKGYHGTANLVHRKGLLDKYGQPMMWDVPDGKNIPGYDHDYKFAQRLLQSSSNYFKLKTPDYRVCHLHNRFDI